MSRIEQIISELEDYVSSCKQVPLSSTKIYVNREEIEELIRELKLKTPEEIKKYQKLISNKDAILIDAKEQADNILRAARIHTEELINEHEIMQRAFEQANQIIDEASSRAETILDHAMEEANGIKFASIQYTDEMLANLQRIIEHSIENNRQKYEGLMHSLDKDLNIVLANRNELRPEQEEVENEEILASSVKDIIENDDNGPIE